MPGVARKTADGKAGGQSNVPTKNTGNIGGNVGVPNKNEQKTNPVSKTKKLYFTFC